MKKLTILIIAIIAGHFSIAQPELGITAFSGPGKVYNDYKPLRYVDAYASYYKFNWMGGVYGSYKISKKSSIELDVNFNQIHSLWGFYVQHDSSGTMVRTYTTEYDRILNYLSIPVSYGYSIGKLKINAGVQYSFLFKNYATCSSSGRYATPYTKSENYTDFIKHDFSFTTFVSYKIYDRFLIEARFNQGVINTTSVVYYDDTKPKFHSRQFLVGVKYSILKKN